MQTIRSYTHAYEGFHNAYARALFFTLLSLVVALMFSYGYFLKSAAFAAAQWEDDQTSLSVLASDVSDLESRYFMRIQALGMNEARAIGLVETKHMMFVARGSDTRLTFAEGNARRERAQ